VFCSLFQSEIDKMTAEETALRQESAGYERSLTVAKLDLKEAQRLLDTESKQRQKAESRLHDLEEQLQTETSSRQAAERSNQQHVERLQHLDKQVKDSIHLG